MKRLQNYLNLYRTFLTKFLTIVIRLFQLPAAIGNAIKWLKTLDYVAEGKYQKAYDNLVSTSKSVSKNNVKHLLMRGYLASKINRREDAINCLEAFFSIIDQRPKLSEQERNYLKKYAAGCYLSILPTVGNNVMDLNTLKLLESSSVKPTEVRNSLKRIFPIVSQ